MEMMFSLDEQVGRCICEKQQEFGAIIFLFKDGEQIYMDVCFSNPYNVCEKQLVSNRDSKDAICVGIMKWFNNYKK